MKNNCFTIINKSSGKLLVLLVFILLAGKLSAQQYWGSGSRDLYPENAKGGRATLYSGVNPTINMPFPTRGEHYVYAEEGETIALASSAQWNSYRNWWELWNTYYQGDLIRLYGPEGNPIDLTTYGDQNNNMRGRISNRDQELAGPRLPGQEAGSNRYQAIYHEVQQSGIYRVEFDGTRRGSESLTDNRASSVLMAITDWTQADNSNYIWAWDVSVANAAKDDWIPGRVYTNVMNMDNNQQDFSESNSINPNGFYGKFSVLTRDGYVYNVDNNGQNGLVFTFMVNNRGFHVVGDPNTPSYSSVLASTLTNQHHAVNRYHDPRTADAGSVVTHKIFYSSPDGNMPEFATGGPVPNQQTWLRIEEINLTVDEILIEGAEGSSNQLGSKGAYIKFYNESGGDYYITIRPEPNSTTNFPERELTGNSVIGENKILWDGKDGNGDPLDVGPADIQVEIKLRGAEVHFPYIDIEQNLYGIKIELLDSEDLTAVISDMVYWDDTAIDNRGNNISKPNPINASHTAYPAGTSSSSNGHKWTSTATSGTWGDEVGLDTWTFIEGSTTTASFEVAVKEADLYTEINYSIGGSPLMPANTPNQSGTPGQTVTFEVTAGNDGPSDVEGSPFTFTVPVGVDITNPNNISFTTSCNNGTVQEAVALTYNESTRTFSSKLDLPDDCTITYTFTGTLSGSLGIKTLESTILRPNDVTDPDATNDDINIPPTNPHYECFNTPGIGGAINCNNIQEATFMLLDDCAVEYLYYEDFGRTTWEENSGRKTFSREASISLNQSTGMPVYNNNTLQRSGIEGGATDTYLFAPGQDDPSYNTANGPHGPSASVARIKNGYYSVNPPGYTQMGIPDTDLWHDGVWDSNAATNDPDNPNSNYDWTQAWDKSDAIRDISGAVNGATFLIRGAAAADKSIKPFYEFDVAGTIQQGETYTLSMYSFVTYHDKDYMIMDVVDKNNGQVYASVPLVYAGPGDKPSGTGPSFGWVPLQASFSFDAQGGCDDIVGKEVKIAIRGSQDRALDSGKGFGHTLIDDISFIKRTTGGSCGVPASSITCEDACYDEVEGEFKTWNHPSSSAKTIETTLSQPGTNGGFVLDIYYLDNSFNMEINGVKLYDEELEFESATQVDLIQNVRFKSGGQWGIGNVSPINSINSLSTDNPLSAVTESNKNDFTPALRVSIDKYGNVTLFGIKQSHGVLEELEVFDSNGVQNLNTIHWIEDTTIENANTVKVTQKVVGTTAMTLFGYGQDGKECEFCDLEKEGVFDDNNSDGFAHAGETITYTFDVINAGDMDIHDVTIIDPLFGFNIKLDENTHQPTQPGITFTGDSNNDGVLDRYETWTFTVKYAVTNEDIFDNKGVYNRAIVTGVGKIGTSEFLINEESTDPTPYTDQDEGWDPARPFHTYVPLKGSGLMITNPNIYHRIKNNQ